MGDNSFAGINFNDPESVSIFNNHKEKMCPKWSDKSPSEFPINIKLNQRDNVYVVMGELKGDLSRVSSYQRVYLKYWAASSPTYNSNFSGSGLPYPNEDMAFDGTSNKGVVDVNGSKFQFTLNYPNSYYVNMGSVYVPPQVNIVVCNSEQKEISEKMVINLGEGIPFRTLTWPKQRNWNDGPMFYDVKNNPVRTQFQILMDSAYPSTNTTPTNFWGMSPSK